MGMLTVLERELVVVVSSFEAVFCHANINLWFAGCGSDTDFSIKWSIVTQASSYRGNPSRCNLCLTEKLCILSADRSTLLNKRSELITKCRHENKFYAANQKQDRSNRPP